MLRIIVCLVVGFMFENSLFEFTHHYYCWKNKGKCSSCKDWSCPRKQYFDKCEDKEY